MRVALYIRSSKDQHNVSCEVRIPVESGQHSGGKKTTVPMGKRPAFRFDCGHHSDEKGQCRMRE